MNVIVFARAPEVGRAKTRLIPALGSDRTHRLYRAFLHDTLASARDAGARVLLAHTPGLVEERALADEAFEQQGATFGERFDHALARGWQRMGGPLVLVGADTPHLGPGTYREAFAALDRNEAALGPSTEGGFHLLGFRGEPIPVAKAFDEANEAAAVARITRAALLAPSFDVDVPEDLVNMILHCETQEAARAWVPPRTMAALREMRVRVDATVEHGTRHRRLVIG